VELDPVRWVEAIKLFLADNPEAKRWAVIITLGIPAARWGAPPLIQALATLIKAIKKG